MRKSLLIGAAGSVVLLCGGIVASAATGITHATTLRLVSTTVESGFVQVGHSGAPRLGDEFVLHQKLTDQQGHPMGDAGIVCTFTSVRGGGATNCVATASLPRGEITVQVLNIGSPSNFDAAVTGGTGAYQNARGEAEIHNNRGNTGTITFFLIP